jgi:hypothetical protein
MDDRGLPKPSAELVIIGAGLLELEVALKELGLKKPDFTERVLRRIQSEQTRRAVVRLRGPRMSEEMGVALDEAEAWAGQASVVAMALKRA